jgi:hypothetical protein
MFPGDQERTKVKPQKVYKAANHITMRLEQKYGGMPAYQMDSTLETPVSANQDPQPIPRCFHGRR